MKKIYFAAPLFNEMELKRNEDLTKKLRESGFDVYLPQESGLSAKMIKDKDDTLKVSRSLFEIDKKAIMECDILIIFLDGRVPDEGACVELGMAYAWNKKCYGYKTDDRSLDFTGTDNLFIEGCLDFKVYNDFNELINAIKMEK